MLQLNQYNPRPEHMRPRKRRTGLLRSLPVSLILVIVAGYVPMIFLLMHDDKAGRNAQQADVFPNDYIPYYDNPDLPDIPIGKQPPAAYPSNDRNPKFQTKDDDAFDSKIDKTQNLLAKHENEKHNEEGDFKILTLPRNDVDFIYAKGPHEPKKAKYKDKYAQPRGSELGQKLRRERDELKQKQDEAAKTTPKPKREAPTLHPDFFENALNKYKLYAQLDKKATPKPVTPQKRKEHMRVTSPHTEVLEAKVIHEVLGNYEVAQPVVKGPGEGGKAVHDPSITVGEMEAAMQEYGFNMAVSDLIALNRTVTDTRPIQCKSWQYPDKLPSASVIIVFHNEGWSTLMRTVHSVMRTAPPQHLLEVIMVDDYSSKIHLKTQLDNYVANTLELEGKVKVFHSDERLGLIKARMYGAQRAQGDVVVFLDAHCECNINWLPPLLSRIAIDGTIIAVPVVDGIDARTFDYHAIYKQPYRGIWEWGFFYKEYMVPRDEVNSWQYLTSPYKSPTHAGGLFAIEKQFLFDMGGYDQGLEIWGGENFELSFKVWMCGGSVEWVPCSRIGHIYRASMPYDMGDKIGPVTQINYLRVIETWMDDEHKSYFYTREPTLRGVQYGDISKQLAFKQSRNCKSFKWFMENVAQDVLTFYPPPPENLRWGEVKEAYGHLCWDTKDAMVYIGYIQLDTCNHGGHTQVFRLNVQGQLAYGEYCIKLAYSRLALDMCKRGTVDGPWRYNTDLGLIEHTATKLCIKSDREKRKVITAPCNSADTQQQWNINKVYPYKHLMSDEFLKQESIKR